MSRPSDDLFPGWTEPNSTPITETHHLPLGSPLRDEPGVSEGQFDLSSFEDFPLLAKQTSLPVSIRSTAARLFPSLPFFGPSPPAAPSDEEFADAVANVAEVVSPQNLGFIPASAWSSDAMTFGQIVEGFFQKRNSSHCRFPHKLFNALRLATAAPHLARHIGVEWVTATVIRVHKLVFARLLKLSAVDGSLFHQQGNFPSHGFVELTEREARACCPPEVLTGVDYEVVRLVRHQDGALSRDGGSQHMENCRWVNFRNVASKSSKT
jgi:hypothetical protein